MKKQEIIKQVLVECYTELLKHKDPSKDLIDIHLSENSRILSYQSPGKVITTQDARLYLNAWITESFEKHGRVLLYTCKDTSMVCIENYDDEIWHSELYGTPDNEDIKDYLRIMND